MIYKIKREGRTPYNVFFSRLDLHFNLEKIHYHIKMDKNCYWGPAADDEDMLLNTLCGIQFGFNIKNCIKILWRPDFNFKNQIYLYVYSHNSNKGIDKITFVKTVSVDHFFNIEIVGFKNEYYEIFIQDTSVAIEKFLPTLKWGFFINPHIHKETEAIHDMSFTIERKVKYSSFL